MIEPGAGHGLLARDVCNAAGHLPEGFGDSLRYAAVDRRPGGRETCDPAFAKIAGDALRLPFRNVTGCIISNELLDALPVHRVRMERGALRELYVGIESDVADGYEGQLVEIAGDPSTPDLERRLSDVGANLFDGQTAEICLLLDDWAASVAASLDMGFVLTIDYGRSAEDLYDPAQRPHGTLVTYRSHRQTDTPLVDPGRQDITAQVDFTSVGLASEAGGTDHSGQRIPGESPDAPGPANYAPQRRATYGSRERLDHHPHRPGGRVARCPGRTVLSSARRGSRLADGPDPPGATGRAGS